MPQLNNTCFVDKNNFIKYSGYLNKNDSANETKLFNQFLCSRIINNRDKLNIEQSYTYEKCMNDIPSENYETDPNYWVKVMNV